ncbi:hypothetical protein [Sphingopyxis sp.]|uniref:hypothetical protein n=1 Tax=Sphingopyxis sp. TaxID=1908224 RepID=UPI002D76FEEF|nr:hypothetical protein [Sphingopyxis sp.]HET6526888.1 hypothetical protein [Sphingopyxis sp.]
MGRSIAGWRLPEAERETLLMRFPPRYPNVVADHVTLRYGTDARTELPAEHAGAVIGEADDGAGVQALVVAIGGRSERGDGSHFHLTWSLAEGRKAKESNDVIAERGWQPIDPPVAVMLEPAHWQP